MKKYRIILLTLLLFPTILVVGSNKELSPRMETMRGASLEKICRIWCGKTRSKTKTIATASLDTSNSMVVINAFVDGEYEICISMDGENIYRGRLISPERIKYISTSLFDKGIYTLTLTDISTGISENGTFEF